MSGVGLLYANMRFASVQNFSERIVSLYPVENCTSTKGKENTTCRFLECMVFTCVCPL